MKILKERFEPLTPLEQDSLLGLISNHLKKNPSEKISFDLLNQMVEDDMDNAASYYIETLKLIDENDLEPAVGLSLQEFSNHPILGNFLNNYFKSNSTRASKAYNLKTKK